MQYRRIPAQETGDIMALFEVATSGRYQSLGVVVKFRSDPQVWYAQSPHSPEPGPFVKRWQAAEALLAAHRRATRTATTPIAKHMVR